MYDHDMTYIWEYVRNSRGITREQMSVPYYMYFDETNNFKKVTKNKKEHIQRTLNLNNVEIKTHFVFGGVATKEYEEPLTLEELKKAVHISLNAKDVSEVKSGSFYDGDFIQAIQDERLTVVLNLIFDRHWFIHFSATSLLYFSIVDIVDGLVWNSAYRLLWKKEECFYLRDEFYKIFACDLENNLKQLIDFDYPAVKKENLHAFRSFIAEMIFKYYLSDAKINHHIKLLINILQDSELYNRDVVFVEDGERGIFIDHFTHFFDTRICMLAYSHLTLDEEGDIQNHLQKRPLFVHGKQIVDYHFVDSKSNTYIQLSDIVVGLMARYFYFLDTDWNNIQTKLDNLTSIGQKNLYLLNEILIYSEKESKLFFDPVERAEVVTNFLRAINTYSNMNNDETKRYNL